VKLLRRDLDAINLERLRPFVRESEWFYMPAGVEHYKLLAYLSTFFQGKTIFDIGSHLGESAHALAYNTSNKIESFDIQDRISPSRRMCPNINFHIANLFEPATREKWKAQLLASPLIFIDVEPHDGRPEYDMIRWLQANKYAGIIVLDDIWHFSSMRSNLWYRIEGKYRTDVTTFGHWSGSGIVSFNEKVECEGVNVPTNWTLVTGYFDLTKMSDATGPIKARSAQHYIEQHAGATLALDHNLVVFCEPANRDRILAMRPKHLHDRTHIVTMSFEDFPLTKYRDQIIKNRGGACPSDDRNTASYYLLCMSRYAMLKRTMQDNPFKSTHFAWINICIERMGHKNLMHLDEALACQREKFSTCYIDYVPERMVNDLPSFFDGKACLGRCTMCSGFFTGSAKYMKAACDKIEEQFLFCLKAGYGHADEQIFNRVFFKNPELFDWYCGDYQEMITNYAYVYERPERPVAHLLQHSYDDKNWMICRRAADIILESYLAGKCKLSEPDLAFTRKARAEAHQALLAAGKKV
jgi:hypothetical protein